MPSRANLYQVISFLFGWIPLATKLGARIGAVGVLILTFSGISDLLGFTQSATSQTLEAIGESGALLGNIAETLLNVNEVLEQILEEIKEARGDE